MTPIPGGKTKVTHPNVNATNTDALPGIKRTNPESRGFDLSGDATNCIGGSIHPTRAESPNSKGHSRNQGNNSYPGMKG